MSPSDDEIREAERKEERKEDQRRENIGFGVLATIGLCGLILAFIAAMNHGVAKWLVVTGFVGGGLVVVPAFGIAWVAIFSRMFGWTVEKPLAKLKTLVQKDDVVSLFTIIIAPVQTLIFFVSSEIIEDKRQKIAVGVIVFVLAIVGGICATLAKNKRMYFAGAGAVVLSLVPSVWAACQYQRWIESFGKLEIFDQIVIIGAFVASILLLVIVIISWPLVKKPKKETEAPAPAASL